MLNMRCRHNETKVATITAKKTEIVIHKKKKKHIDTHNRTKQKKNIYI